MPLNKDTRSRTFIQAFLFLGILFYGLIIAAHPLFAQVPEDLREKLRAQSSSKADRRDAARKILQLNSQDSRDLIKSELRHSQIADIKEAILEELSKNWDRQFFLPVFEAFNKGESKALKEDANAVLDSLDPAELQRHLQELYSAQAMNQVYRIAAVDYMADRMKTLPSEFAAAQTLFDILKNGEDDKLKEAAWKCMKKISGKSSAKDDLASWEKYVDTLRDAASPSVRIQELELRLQKMQEEFKTLLTSYVEERQEVLRLKNDPALYLREYKESPYEEMRLAALRYFEQKKEAGKELKDDLLIVVETAPAVASSALIAQSIRTLAALHDERVLEHAINDDCLKGSDDLRRAAAYAIGEFGEASIVHIPKLQALLTDSTSGKDARKAAALGLLNIGVACQKPDERQTVIGILADHYELIRQDNEQATLRFSIIHGLGNRLRNELKVKELMLKALDDSDKRIAFFSMEFVSDFEAVPKLVNLLGSQDDGIRNKASETLKRLSVADMPVLEDAAVFDALQETDGVINDKSKLMAEIALDLLRGKIENAAALKKEQLQENTRLLRIVFGELKQRQGKINKEILKTILSVMTKDNTAAFGNELILQVSAGEKMKFFQGTVSLAAEILIWAGNSEQAGDLLELELAEKDLLPADALTALQLLMNARFAQAQASAKSEDYGLAVAAAEKTLEALKGKAGESGWWKAQLLRLDCQIAMGDFQAALNCVNDLRVKPGIPTDEILRKEFDRVDKDMELVGKISALLRDLSGADEEKRKRAESDLMALPGMMKTLPKFLKDEDPKVFLALHHFLVDNYKVPNDFRLLVFESQKEEKERQIQVLLQNPPEKKTGS